jgi:hypothetical protein
MRRSSERPRRRGKDIDALPDLLRIARGRAGD